MVSTVEFEASATKAPRPCCDQMRPSERSLAIASRTTLRLTPKVVASACSVGNWSPGFSRPCAISREIELATSVDRCGPRLTLSSFSVMAPPRAE